MKLFLVGLLMVSAAVAMPPALEVVEVNNGDVLQGEILPVESGGQRNFIVDMFVRQVIAFIRNIINNGNSLVGIPPLDPLVLDHMAIKVPAGLINLDMELRDILFTGLGSFKVLKSQLQIRDLSLDLDIVVPRLDIKAGLYDLVGDMFTLVPLYGKGSAHFIVEDVRVTAKIQLGQSPDGKAVILKKIDQASFEIPYLKSSLSGVIGGGDIDNIVNAVIEDVIVNYVRRFHDPIVKLFCNNVIDIANSVLGELDTWRFIDALL